MVISSSFASDLTCDFKVLGRQEENNLVTVMEE